MQDSKHIIIFSHGFGTKKDDRGLLSGTEGIAELISGDNVETILFDYNDVDNVNNTITVKTLKEQVDILNKKIEESRNTNTDVIIDIIAHSQGCLVPAILLPEGIRKIILLAPPLTSMSSERMVNLFKDNPGSLINLEGTSRLARKDGTITIVPSFYWHDREKENPIYLYNELSKKTDLYIINANQDQVLDNLSISGLNDSIKIINIDGDHNFNGASRENLLKQIKQIIL